MNGSKAAGFSPDGKTFVVGEKGQAVKRIFVDGSHQFARNDFAFALNRFGAVNEITSHDVQKTIVDGALGKALSQSPK